MVGRNQANNRHRGRGRGRGSMGSGRGRGRGPEAGDHEDHGVGRGRGSGGGERGDEAANHAPSNATRLHSEGSENVHVGAGASIGRGSCGGRSDEPTGLGDGLENLGFGVSTGGRGNGAVEYHQPRSSYEIRRDIRIRRGGGRGVSISGGRGNEAVTDRFDDNVMFNGEGLDDDDERESSECPEGSNTQGSVHAGHINRVLLFLDPSGQQFEDHGAVGRKIVANLRNMFGGGWPTWRSVPALARERLWDRFRGQYEWDPEIEELVRGLWEEHNASRFSDMLRNARDDAFERAEEDGIEVGDDLSLLMPYYPPWMRQEYWLLLVRHWNSEKWKKVSRVNKANKANSRGGFHTTGSATFLTTRRRLITLTLVRYPEDHPDFDEELWNECAGGRKRGRLYGGSNSKDPVYVLTGAPSSSSTRQRRDPEEVKKLLETVEELRVREEERNERERTDREERERLHKQVEDMNKKIAELLKYLPQPPPS